MKRRDFLRLTVAGSAVAMLPGCGEGGGDAGRDAGGGSVEILGRTGLLPCDDIVSMHEHVDSRQGAELLLRAMDASGIRHMNLLGCYPSLMHGARSPDFSGARENNELLAGLVADRPGRFSWFALIDGREPDPVAALQGWLERGAIGVKLYNGAQGKYRTMPLDDPRLVPLLEFCELHGVPILVHVDPPHLDEFLAAARDYPALPWICPHLFVMTRPEHVPRLARILRRHPGIHTDASFGFENWMHSNLSRLSESRDAVREIFIRHADRILFGTDVVVATDSPHRTAEWAANSFAEYRKFLELDSFHHRVRSRKEVFEGDLLGLALPDDVLRKIYVENSRSFLGRTRPRWDADDLDGVLAGLPPAARTAGNGGRFLFAVAAVASLSPIEGLGGPAEAVERWLATAELAAAAAAALGLPAERFEILADAGAVKAAAAANPSAAAVIPLAELDARLRALPIGGFDPSLPAISRCGGAGAATRAAYFGDYPLLLPVEADATAAAAFRFAPHELRTVVLTGGTLFGKGMTEADTLPPSRAVAEIAPLTRAADVAHLSVENVIREGCRQDTKKWRFCYEPEWLEAIDLLGADVIDITGNHQPDFGREALERTLSTYDRLGLPTFGGGRNRDAALEPAVIRVRGLRIGFTGINRVTRDINGAGPDRPGPLTAYADGVLDDALARARQRSDLFFFTYQGGYEFSPFPWNDLLRHAHRAVDAGAIGAVGVQTHMPAGAEVYREAVVAYGLGNFLFRHPPTAIPHRPETEQGLVLRVTLYGKRLLQAAFLPVRNENGAVRPDTEAGARSCLARVRLGSRPGLAPERVLERCADGCVDIGEPNDFDGPGRVQVKVGLTGMLVGMSAAAAREAGGASAALAVLRGARKRGSHWNAPNLKLALPVAEGEALPAEGFDAVRIHLDSPDADRSGVLKTALAAGLPIQLRVARGVPLAAVSRLLAKSRGAPVILSGLADFARDPEGLAALLAGHGNVHCDTSATDPAGFVELLDGFENDREAWQRLFRSFPSRLLLASGASSWSKRLRWELQPRLLRGLCRALEREEYRRPLLDEGNLSEWAGYRYCDEPLRRGLALGPALTDSVAGGNFHRLFGAG
jgi:predicted TIM-barrel fold metal-dependent hydrolase/poly-gamma-glutamate capsule biosynthesis protein CapA/YwtB (metallophosphatase superfamily)